MDINNYKLNCLGSPIDERDIYYSDIACADSAEVVIPKSFHLGYQFNPKNQGKMSTCFLHANSEWDEIVYSMNEQISVGFLNADRDDDDFQGLGTIPRQVLKHAVNDGNVLNVDFPVNEDYPGIKDTLNKYGRDKLFAKAAMRKSKGFIALNIEDIKRYLVTEKKPILIIVKVYKNFYELQNNGGIIPDVPIGSFCGNHAMLIEGFDGDVLNILNSWGQIGDKGFVHLNLNTNIIKELWTKTDERVIKPTPTPIPGPTPVGSILYRVQLGAFKVRAYADELVLELSKKGIDSCVRIYPDLFKVQCGVFKIRDNAVAMQNKLKELGYDCFIVEVK